MSIPKAVSVGLAGNELSKVITGTCDVSAGRTAVATGSGALIGGAAVGIAAAPITVPLAVAGGAIAFIASLFD